MRSKSTKLQPFTFSVTISLVASLVGCLGVYQSDQISEVEIKTETLPPLPLSVKDVQEPERREGFNRFTPGYGFDPDTGYSTQPCVELKSGSTLPASWLELPLVDKRRAQIDTLRNFGEDSKSFETAMELSIAAKANYGAYSGNANFKKAAGFKSGAFNSWMRIGSQVMYGYSPNPFFKGDLRLTRAAKSFLKDGTFYEQCGKAFAIRVRWGAQYSATYVLSTTSEAEYNTIKASMKAAANGFGDVSANYKESMKKVFNSKNIQSNITTLGVNFGQKDCANKNAGCSSGVPSKNEGGSDVEKNKVGSEDILQSLENEAKVMVERTIENPAIVAYEFTSYDGVEGFKGSSSAVGRQLLEELAYLVDRKDAIGYVKKNAEFFGGYSSSRADSEISVLTNKIQRINEMLNGCISHSKASKSSCDKVSGGFTFSTQHPLPEPIRLQIVDVTAANKLQSIVEARGDDIWAAEMVGSWVHNNYRNEDFECHAPTCPTNYFVLSPLDSDGPDVMFPATLRVPALIPRGTKLQYHCGKPGTEAPCFGDPGKENHLDQNSPAGVRYFKPVFPDLITVTLGSS